jgi:hypothetical protein
MKQLAVAGRDVDGGKAGAGVGFEGLLHAVVGGDEVIGEVAVDCDPEILIHTAKIVSLRCEGQADASVVEIAVVRGSWGCGLGSVWLLL